MEEEEEQNKIDYIKLLYLKIVAQVIQKQTTKIQENA